MASAVYSGPTWTEGSMTVTAEGKLPLSYCWQEIEKRRLQEMTKLLWLDGVPNALMRQVRGNKRLGKTRYNSLWVSKREERMGERTCQATYICTHTCLSDSLWIVHTHAFLITSLLAFWNSFQVVLDIFLFFSKSSVKQPFPVLQNKSFFFPPKIHVKKNLYFRSNDCLYYYHFFFCTRWNEWLTWNKEQDPKSLDFDRGVFCLAPPIHEQIKLRNVSQHLITLFFSLLCFLIHLPRHQLLLISL